MRKVVKFKLSGDYGHFKIPYSNNNPLTYSFITKPALIGFIGAVVGIERKEMKRLFPILCENLKYSLSFNKELKKETVSSYCYNFNNISKSDRPNKSPKPMEYLKNPDWNIYISLVGENDEATKIFDCFCENLIDGIYIWAPTLGIKQCNCMIQDVEIGECEKHNGYFNAKTFVINYIDNDLDNTIYTDNIPTHQDENWYNDIKKEISVYFVDNNQELSSLGEFYRFKSENLVMI